MNTCEKCRNWRYPLTYDDGSIAGECYPRVMGNLPDAVTDKGDTCELFAPALTSIDQLVMSLNRSEGLSVKLP